MNSAHSAESAAPTQPTSPAIPQLIPLTNDLQGFCLAEARKYKDRTQWRLLSGRSFRTAEANGWLDVCTKHMSKSRNRTKGAFTKEVCAQSAALYKTRTEWAANDNSTYNYARKRGWLNELAHHMPRTPGSIIAERKRAEKNSPKDKADHKGSANWTKERVLDSARQYKTRTQWALLAETAYKTAVKNGWVKEAVALMPKFDVAKYPVGYWTKQRCEAIALAYDRRTVWAANHPASYNAARRNNWIEEVTGHMSASPSQKAAAKQQANIPVKSPKKAAPTAVDSDFIIQNAKQMPRGYWTKARVMAVAKKFNSRSEWRAAAPHIYDIATRKAWLKSCSRHMVDPKYMSLTLAKKLKVVTPEAASNMGERFVPNVEVNAVEASTTLERVVETPKHVEANIISEPIAQGDKQQAKPSFLQRLLSLIGGK